MKKNSLYRITGPNMCAGVEVSDEGIIIKTAPILRRYFGVPLSEMKIQVALKGQHIEIVEDLK